MDTNFKEMNTEQLEQFINSSNANGINEESSNTEEVSNVEISETEEQIVEEAEVTEESKEDKPKETEEETTKTADEKPFYKNKTREEIIEMQENATKKISRQENELYNMRKELADIRKQISKNQESKENSEIDDILSEYSEDDRKAIEVLIEKKLKDKEAFNNQQSEEQLRLTEKENESFWANAKVIIDPSYQKDIEESLITEIRTKGQKDTLHKPGWVKDYVQKQLENIRNSGEVKSSSKNNLVKKKVKAATITGGSSVSTSNGWKGKPEPKNSADYREWAKENLGLVI